MAPDPAFLPAASELITERARVLRVADGVAWVQCESQAGCARCAAGEGCGAGLFSRLLRGRLQELPVRLPGNLEREPFSGEWVLIGLSTAAVQNASLLMYGLPLAGLLGGAVAGSLGAGNDLFALLGALAGMTAGFVLARWRAAHVAGDGSLQPVMLRILRPEEPCPAVAEA